MFLRTRGSADALSYLNNSNNNSFLTNHVGLYQWVLDQKQDIAQWSKDLVGRYPVFDLKPSNTNPCGLLGMNYCYCYCYSNKIMHQQTRVLPRVLLGTFLFIVKRLSYFSLSLTLHVRLRKPNSIRIRRRIWCSHDSFVVIFAVRDNDNEAIVTVKARQLTKASSRFQIFTKYSYSTSVSLRLIVPVISPIFHSSAILFLVIIS